MESYLLKSSIALLVFYLLYKVILHNEVNSQVKRFVGLACVLFSVCLFGVPDFSLVPMESAPIVLQTVVATSNTLEKDFSAALPQDSLSPFLLVYLVGVGAFSLRFLAGIIHLARLYSSAAKRHDWGFTVVTTHKKISPFTFFRLLFLSKEDLRRDNIQALILHEQVHRDQWHSLDALLLQFATILFWFHPAIWLFQKDIRSQHEFLADEEVLKKGFDKSDYQQMLFEEQTGVSIQSVNYLSIKTSLKQRFNMMEKSTFNTKNSYFRAALFLPLMAIAILVSSFSPALDKIAGTDGFPQFKLYTESGEVDLTKGISKETQNLFIRAIAQESSEVDYRVSNTDITHVSEGLGAGLLEAVDVIDLNTLFNSKKPTAGDLLALTIHEYQTRDEDGKVETVALDKKIYMIIPLN